MILALVLAGHLLGDWVVQSDRMAAGKVKSWWWNQAHVATYHATLIACVAWRWHSWFALGALAVSWATHSIIDRRWPVARLMRATGSAAFAETSWGPMAVDQALHVAILCLLVGAY